MATDDLRRIRQSNAEAKKRLERVRERLKSQPDPDDDGLDRDTLREILVDELGKRPVLESTGELVIDAAKRTFTLRGHPWVIFAGLAAVCILAWLVLK